MVVTFTDDLHWLFTVTLLFDPHFTHLIYHVTLYDHTVTLAAPVGALLATLPGPFYVTDSPTLVTVTLVDLRCYVVGWLRCYVGRCWLTILI